MKISRKFKVLISIIVIIVIYIMYVNVHVPIANDRIMKNVEHQIIGESYLQRDRYGEVEQGGLIKATEIEILDEYSLVEREIEQKVRLEDEGTVAHFTKNKNYKGNEEKYSYELIQVYDGDAREMREAGNHPVYDIYIKYNG